MTKQIGTIHTPSQITLEDIALLLHAKPVRIKLSSTLRKDVNQAFASLHTLSQNQLVYGINTGFGPMANQYISSKQQIQLQYNLIRSHSCGLGDALPAEYVQAIMLVRLSALLQGYSGVSWPIITQLKKFIELGVTPVVPVHGSVGASGDLIQLAHIALALIGEGQVLHKGRKVPTTKIFRTHTIKPVQLQQRDGLALINGTAAMTGVAAINVLRLQYLIENCIRQTAFLFELFSVHLDCTHPHVGSVRPHTGQRYVADTLRTILKNSVRVKNCTKYSQPKNEADNQVVALGYLLQDVYSLRCAPQIIGPAYDSLQQSIQIIEHEMNAVTDNPIIADGEIIHNGNFHGDYVSLEMDKLRIVIAKLSLLTERHVNLLVNPSINKMLPPYANRGTVGLDLALQAAQFVATSTAAENQTLATPISIHSIPTNNDNQDIVSMGFNSAMLTKQTIDNLTHIQAVAWLTIGQVVDLLRLQDSLPDTLQETYNTLRRHVPELIHDRVLHEDLVAVEQLLKNHQL